MNSLKNDAIKKVFGVRLEGGMGLALSLLERASMVNWEALWPQFQKAMIGLGIAAIATIRSEAIRKGLSELAERIAAFQPTVSPMPGEPLTRAEAIPIPYVPVPAFPETIERIREHVPTTPPTIEYPELESALIELQKAGTMLRNILVPPGDPRRNDACNRMHRAILALRELAAEHPIIGEWFWVRDSLNWAKELYEKECVSSETREIWEKLPSTHPGW